MLSLKTFAAGLNHDLEKMQKSANPIVGKFWKAAELKLCLDQDI